MPRIVSCSENTSELGEDEPPLSKANILEKDGTEG